MSASARDAGGSRGEPVGDVELEGSRSDARSP